MLAILAVVGMLTALVHSGGDAKPTGSPRLISMQLLPAMEAGIADHVWNMDDLIK